MCSRIAIVSVSLSSLTRRDSSIFTAEQINLALKVLENDGVILYPTSTVWGIGCLASSKVAIDKIRSIKRREITHSFIGLIESEKSLNKYVSNVPKEALKIIKESSIQMRIRIFIV